MENVHEVKSRGSQVQLLESSPRTVTREALNPSSSMGQHVIYQGSSQGIHQGLYTVLVTWASSTWHYSNPRPTEGNQDVSINCTVCINNWDTVSHSYQGILGTLLKSNSKMPSKSQPYKLAFQRTAVLGLQG